MKEKILHSIYRVFSQWSSNLETSCGRGCNVCCTQNVTITATEGIEILRYVVARQKIDWFTRSLAKRDFVAPRFTTNDFARACMEGREIDISPPQNQSPCPFLKSGECAIYPVRPFACRLFISRKKCSKTQPAIVPDHYLDATVAVSQLIEHLGQKEYWGNMLDVLAALLDISEFKEISEKAGAAVSIQGRLQTLTAQPLPGFLLSDEAGRKVMVLLELIFEEKINGKKLEDILNGQ